jgi:hypothetical protein
MRSALSALPFALFLVVTAPLAAQLGPSGALHRPLDEVLDVYVRDGFVYYRALRSERRTLDSYLGTLERLTEAQVTAWPREQQIALWLNAYNAHVLEAVIDRYPISGRSTEYPRNSIRQIPGVFERTPRRVAGRSLPLDQIETEVLGGFNDPRLTLALGRGSIGGGRLRSEAFVAEKLEVQLGQVAAEVTTRHELLRIDPSAGTISVSPILSWREAMFVSAYADDADARFAQRSPIERAIIAFILPNLLPGERELVLRNDFRVAYHEYDWRLNDLTGGAPR